MSIVHSEIADVAGRPVSRVITVRGKELAVDATVAEARAVFESSSVQLIPVLDGQAYVGSVTRDDLEGADDAALVTSLELSTPPVTTASTEVSEALPVLDEDGSRRLVVLADDRSTYVGLVCLTRDRARLCIDAECHG